MSMYIISYPAPIRRSPQGRVFIALFLAAAVAVGVGGFLPAPAYAVTTGTLYPDGQGTYTSWNGTESNIDETSSISCGSLDGSGNVASGDGNTGRESVLVNLSSIPNGASIMSVSVSVWYTDDSGSGSDGTFKTFARLNGSNTDAGSDLVASGSSSSSCNHSDTQVIDVADVVKSDATTLEIGVVKTGTDTSSVWVGALRATVTYTHVPVPFSDSFGASSQNDIPMWDEEGNDSGAATGVVGSSSSGDEDEYRSSGNPKFAKIAKDEWICLNLDASDDTSLSLSYWWKGDADTESNDYGIVEYKVGSGDCGASGWTALQSHALNSTSWQERAAFSLPGALSNTTFRLRFRTNSSSGDEYFRVDDVAVTTGPTTGTLVVKKVVVNDNGGTAATSSFAFQVDGGAAQYFESDGQNDLTVSAGTHSVTEPSVAGYTTSYSNCTNVNVPAGGSATCVITNDDMAPTLTVTKIVENNDGGTLGVGDFPLFVNGNSVTSGVTSTYGAGTYTVTETNQPGYVGTFGGDCNASGTVALSVGDVKSCTLTNDDVAPGLTVIKQVINDHGGTAQVSDFTLYVGTTTVTSGQTVTLDAGTYAISESGGPSGYTASFSGDCDANGSVTLAVGATSTYTCTLTNDDVEPKLTVTKTIQGGTAQISDFPLFVGNTQVTSGVQNGFSVGSYTVSEVAGNLPYIATIAGDCASDGSLTLAPGDVKSCTLTNEYLPPPTASPSSGTYDDPQSVTLSTTGPLGTTVRYTTDGTAPGCASVEYTGPIAVAHDTPLRAVACYGNVQSFAIWENYVIGPHSSGAGQLGGGGGEVLGESTSTETGGGASTSTATSTTTSTPPFSAPIVEVLGAATETPACVAEGEYLRDYLWYGRPNDPDEVKKLQIFLNEREGAALPVTGFFGALTRDAVSAFQLKYAADILAPWGETAPTGHVYKLTKWKINSLWCPAFELEAPRVP